MTMSSIIVLDGVKKIYKMGDTELEALSNSNVEIEDGEFVAVMGPSGSGKSTLMNMIGALDTPTTGDVNVGGEKISNFSQDELAMLRSKKIGFIFQQFNLIPSMNAAENVALPMLFTGAKKKKRNKRAEMLLEKVGLGERLNHMPSELSGGQRQRVSIARALANNPDIILADEPTGNLDSETGENVMNLLTELNREGKTIVMVTHDENDAEYADRVIKIEDGKTGVEQ